MNPFLNQPEAQLRAGFVPPRPRSFDRLRMTWTPMHRGSPLRGREYSTVIPAKAGTQSKNRATDPARRAVPSPHREAYAKMLVIAAKAAIQTARHVQEAGFQV